MSRFAHSLFHGLMIVIQYANLASHVIPTPYQPIVAAAVALTQGIVALAQHPAPADVKP